MNRLWFLGLSVLLPVSAWATSTTYVGIGTTNPQTVLEVDNTTSNSPRGITNNQYSSDARGSQFHAGKARGTLSSPSPPLAGDNLGNFLIDGYTGLGWSSTVAVLATAEDNFSSTAGGTQLSLWTTPDGTYNLTQQMTIKGNGYVGIGTTSPSSLLDVESGGSSTGNITQDGMSVPVHIGYAQQTANVAVAGGGWTNMTGAALTFTLKRTMTVHMRLMGSIVGTEGNTSWGYCGFRFLVDSTGSGDPTWGNLITGNGGTWSAYSVEYEQSLAAGSHTIQAQVTGYSGYTSGCTTYGTATPYGTSRMTVDAF